MRTRWARAEAAAKPRSLLAFLVVAGLGLSWSFATPLFGIADEPAQIMQSAAVVRGQLVGTPAQGPNTVVDIPGNLIGANRTPCFMLRPQVNAGCETPLGNDSQPVEETTWVGYYPPLYYATVGWPSLFLSGADAIYAMRAVAALVCALLLVAAFASAAEARGRALLIPATAALATPYLFVYMGTVNPSGMEMAAALCAWNSGAALANAPPPERRRWILIRFGIGLAVLAQVRYIGPVFVLAVVLCVAGWHGYRASEHLLKRPRMMFMAAVVFTCTLFATIWTLVISNRQFAVVYHSSNWGVWALLTGSTARYFRDLIQLVGHFSWGETHSPGWATTLGLGFMVGLVVVSFRHAPRRVRTIVLVLAGFSVAFPILLTALVARHEGFLGQGRYWFPLLAGVLVIAAEAGGESFGRSTRDTRTLWSVLAVSMIAIHVSSFQTVLDRFRFGWNQPHAIAGWNPPGGATLWLVTYTILILGLTAWWWRLRKVEPMPNFGPVDQAVVEPELPPVPDLPESQAHRRGSGLRQDSRNLVRNTARR